jgi:mycothiol system anti-sigma-R factor
VSADTGQHASGDAGGNPYLPGYSGSGGPADPLEESVEKMDCTDALNRVYLYLDGEIDGTTVAAAKEHLEACAPCLREYGLEEEVKRLVRRACGCEDVPTGLRERVMLRIREVTVTIRHD